MRKSPALQGVKKTVLEVPAYTLRAYEAEVKLNQNESPYDFPEDLKQEVVRIYLQKQWSRYPDFVPDSLRARLAEFVGWKKEGVLVGNGSNELLQATLMVLVGNRTPVAIPSPTFTVYGLIATVLGAKVVRVPLNPDMSYDVTGLIEQSNAAEARLMIICTPNNPTGSILLDRDIQRILDEFSGYVLLDEAYFEFGGRTGLPFLERYPRLIITRTFSKAMGLAGLRIGYLLAHPDLTAQIEKAKLPYNINQFSLTAAAVALDHIDRFRPSIDAILREKERLGRELASLPGIRVYPSGANFFLIEVPVPPTLLYEELYEEGVLIRDVSRYPMLSNCLRITVGTPGENDRFLAALRGHLPTATEAGSVTS